MTTLTLGASSMSLGSPSPVKLTMGDVVTHGYFELGVHPGWSQPDLEQKLPGSTQLLKWLHKTFARSENGRVEYEVALKEIQRPEVNPYMLQPAVNATNLAWAFIEEAETKNGVLAKLQSIVAAQVEAMTCKLKQQYLEGKIQEQTLTQRLQAAEQWKASKLAGAKQDVDEKEKECLHAVTAASTEILRLWVELGDSKLDPLSESPEKLMDVDDMLQELENNVVQRMSNLNLSQDHKLCPKP